ncbi:MAG: hypothetical protein ACPL07_03735 [Candidatus Bathyarchaeia archaeon]
MISLNLGKQFWMWIAAFLLCTTIAGFYASIFFYTQAESAKANYEGLMKDLKELTTTIDMKIDYGNGTIVWHNGTMIPMNSSLLAATMRIGKVEYSIGDFGAFIISINGLKGDSNHFWSWSYFDRVEGDWVYGPVACDKWMLHNGDLICWTYMEF